jgi:hypothetical protein
MPKNGLLLLNLATGESVRVARVKSFQVPARGGAWVAYLKETEPAAKDAPAAEKPDEKPAEEPVSPVADQPAATPEAKPAPKTSAVAPRNERRPNPPPRPGSPPRKSPPTAPTSCCATSPRGLSGLSRTSLNTPSPATGIP